jgi:ribonuclease R
MQKSDSGLPAEDPFKAREAEKYASPIASREYLLEVMRSVGAPMSYEDFLEQLQYQDPEQQEALRRRLKAMLRDGQAILNRQQRYLPVNQDDLISGRVVANSDGFGFLVPDVADDKGDIFLNHRVMRSLLHGDRAVVRVSGVDHKNRREGVLVEVLERAHTEIVGRLQEDNGIYLVKPENNRLHLHFLVPEKSLHGAKVGQMVRLRIVEQPTAKHDPIAEVLEVLVEGTGVQQAIAMAIHTYHLPEAWPDAVLQAIAQMQEEVAENAKTEAKRKDLRQLPFVTIDGEDAKDFDDALYVELRPRGFRLWVAIADVAYYVTPDSALDQEAFKRGTSVYFPGKVLPMLPDILSNGLCSLKPKVDRLAMVAELWFDQSGQMKRSTFYPAVIHSQARLTYTQVAAWLEADFPAEQQALQKPLRDLETLYRLLNAARKARGALDFDTVESRFLFNDQGEVVGLVPVQRKISHGMVEECMIAANIAAARFLKRHKIPALYRVHEPPDKQKLEDLKKFLLEMGFPATFKKHKPEPKEFAELLRLASERPDAHWLQTRLLRALTQAVYSGDRTLGHFGLALEDYAHFTSPIRRYPDLLVHRAIRFVLTRSPFQKYRYQEADMKTFGDHCSMTERRADEATRDVTAVLKCQYMQDKLGEVFEGVVVSVTSFGLFVEMDEVYIEGLIHISNLGAEFYHFDPVQQVLIGERSGHSYRMGDVVTVQVARVSVEERKIDLALWQGKTDESKSPEDSKPRKSRKRRRS